MKSVLFCSLALNCSKCYFKNFSLVFMDLHLTSFFLSANNWRRVTIITIIINIILSLSILPQSPKFFLLAVIYCFKQSILLCIELFADVYSGILITSKATLAHEPRRLNFQRSLLHIRCWTTSSFVFPQFHLETIYTCVYLQLDSSSNTYIKMHIGVDKHFQFVQFVMSRKPLSSLFTLSLFHQFFMNIMP